MAAGLLAGCAKTECSKPVQIEGAVFGGRTDDVIAAEVKFDTDWITRADNTKYNSDLAAFSALLSADSYFREKDLAKGTQNRVLFADPAEEYDWTSFLKAVGFTDVKHIESYKEKEYSADGNDSVTMTLGYRNVDGKYDSFAVVFRGCFSAQEWVSTFDPGSDSAAYTELTGEHSEWTDTAHFKGLDIAANRAGEFIRDFIAEHDDPGRQNCILFTGHSRGGSLANMIGADFEKNSDAKTYTYTFNTMPVTTDANAGDCRTVFNIFDSGDFYTDPLPFGGEQFFRYGTDKSLSIGDSEKVRAAVAELKGRDDYACIPGDAESAYRELFAARFPDRASLYETESVTQVFDTEEEASARLEECLTLIGAESGLDLGELCTMRDVVKTGDGKYELTMEYCSAALLTSYSKVLAYGDTAYEAVKTLFAEDEAGCSIAELLVTNLPGISAGHLLINSYILAGCV